MAAGSYEVLKTAKSALDAGLINDADYDKIKCSFLRAQQIKAGLDAGFIKEEEYANVKRAFLESLSLTGHSAAHGGARLGSEPVPCLRPQTQSAGLAEPAQGCLPGGAPCAAAARSAACAAPDLGHVGAQPQQTATARLRRRRPGRLHGPCLLRRRRRAAA